MSKSLLSVMQKVELLKRIAGNPDIPSPPTLILRVLEKASMADCTINELCKIIQIDSGLSAKILRIVNSALFGLSRPATSIQRALTVVGINSARLLVLAIALPEMNQKTKLPAAVAQRYWRSSIAGAIVAHEFAQRLHLREAEDDMAAGLLRDLGALVLQQVFPAGAAEMARQPAEALIRGKCDLEEMHYGLHHAEVSAFILDGWRLPVDMTEPIRWHHAPEQGSYSTPKAENRAYILNFAVRAAQVISHPDHPIVLHELCALAKSRFLMSAEDVVSFLSPLGRKVADFAALLQVDIGTESDFAGALTRAREELVQLALSTSLDNQRALDMSRRAESEAQRWRQEAVFDPLTKLFNRRFLDRKLQEFFDNTKRGPFCFVVLYLDLDGFKPLNDRFGHAFGDLVLQKVAGCLQDQVRQGDIVARHGGDEFCIVGDAMDQAGLESLALRVLEAIQKMTVRQGANVGRVGASIGAVWCNPSTTWCTPEELLCGADRAMYVAKSRGKNRVVLLNSLNDVGVELPAPLQSARCPTPVYESR